MLMYCANCEHGKITVDPSGFYVYYCDRYETTSDKIKLCTQYTERS